jgi:phosphate acetyltransferase
LARNLYITAMEPQSGKTVVSLGIMELLSTRVERLGFFRPSPIRRSS